jgi:taurine dioxygenase
LAIAAYARQASGALQGNAVIPAEALAAQVPVASPRRASNIAPNPGGFGALITGIDVRCLDAAGFAAVEDAFNQYSVICIRGQELSPPELRDFINRFGALATHTLVQYTLPQMREIYVLSNIEENGKPIGAHNEGIGWHTDLSYKQRPVMATALYGIVCPPEGADTLFADMTAAYAELPADERARLDGLRIHHSYQSWMATRADRAPLTDAQKAQTPDVWHPLVRTHPVTRRKSLYIGTGTVYGIEGMPRAEGKALVDGLVEYATQERFTLAHKWRMGDLVMWDNRCTLHTGTLFNDVRYKRLIHRLMVEGDVPF